MDDSSDNSRKSGSYRPRQKQVIEAPMRILPPPAAKVAVPVEITPTPASIEPPPFTVPTPNLPPPIDTDRAKRKVTYLCPECGAKHTEYQAWYYSEDRRCVICDMVLTPIKE